MNKKLVANELVKIAKKLSQEEVYKQAYKTYRDLDKLRNEFIEFDKKAKQLFYQSDFADLVREFYKNFKGESIEIKKQLLYPELDDIFSGPYNDMKCYLIEMEWGLSRVIQDAIDRARDLAAKCHPEYLE